VADTNILDEQARYYRERAPEYDDWWFRRGRYDNGPEANARWFTDVAEVEAALVRFGARGDVLELACGTGLWTRHLVRTARRVTAVDASPEVIALNRARIGDADVEYVQADIFGWRPAAAAYDVCFFGFWLSHVPEDEFDRFWDTVAAALRPEGRMFFVDSVRAEHRHARVATAGETEIRRLADGREFAIVKRYWDPPALEQRLASLGWRARVTTTANGLILYGSGGRS
jgi:SAM-dependent methyltransferase